MESVGLASRCRNRPAPKFKRVAMVNDESKRFIDSIPYNDVDTVAQALNESKTACETCIICLGPKSERRMVHDHLCPSDFHVDESKTAEREGFEKWAASEGMSLVRYGGKGFDLDYLDGAIDLDWDVWQASADAAL